MEEPTFLPRLREHKFQPIPFFGHSVIRPNLGRQDASNLRLSPTASAEAGFSSQHDHPRASLDGGNQQTLLSEGQSSSRHVVENVNVISPGTEFLIVDFVFSLSSRLAYHDRLALNIGDLRDRPPEKPVIPGELLAHEE